VERKKVSIAPCSGMSPYGLVARVAALDTVEESENAISICITATSADREGFRNLIRKYPIIAVNGCENACVDKILDQKGVKVSKTINIMKSLHEEGLKPEDSARLDEKGELCVKAVKKKIKGLINHEMSKT
jgi:uncharacterized metal-binding protein